MSACALLRSALLCSCANARELAHSKNSACAHSPEMRKWGSPEWGNEVLPQKIVSWVWEVLRENDHADNHRRRQGGEAERRRRGTRINEIATWDITVRGNEKQRSGMGHGCRQVCTAQMRQSNYFAVETPDVKNIREYGKCRTVTSFWSTRNQNERNKSQLIIT